MTRAAFPLFLAALLIGGAARPVSAQAPDSMNVDHVAAIVGPTVILASAVSEELYSRVNNGVIKMPPPSDSAGMKKIRRDILDDLIAIELMLQEASSDTTIKVTDQDVSDAVDQTMRGAQKRIPNPLEFQRELRAEGFNTIEDWRNWLKEQQRKVLTITRFREAIKDKGLMKPMTPTDKEMRADYAQNVQFWPTFPEMISMNQIIVAPKPDSAAKLRTKTTADSIVKALRAGADFATAARRFSTDPGSKDQGGDLLWKRQGEFVPAFDKQIFAPGLKPGQILEPFETQFGIHIVQMIRSTPTEVHVAHILLMPDVDSAAQGHARRLADSVYAMLKRGVSFDSLQRVYLDPAEDRHIEGYPVDSLIRQYAPYKIALEGVDTGQVTKPFELPSAMGPLRSKWAILKVTKRVPPGPPTFDFVKESIRKRLSEDMGRDAYIKTLRAKTYIDIRDP